MGTANAACYGSLLSNGRTSGEHGSPCRPVWLAVGLAVILFRPAAHAILAGHEDRLPADFPSQRIDSAGPDSPFNFVGALSISSGGPVLVEMGEGYGFVGVSTFTEGFGGRFGDIGGGIVLEPYYDWIAEMTGVVIPESAAVVLLAGIWGMAIILIARSSRRR